MTWPDAAAILGATVIVAQYLHERLDLRTNTEELERRVAALEAKAGTVAPPGPSPIPRKDTDQ